MVTSALKRAAIAHSTDAIAHQSPSRASSASRDDAKPMANIAWIERLQLRGSRARVRRRPGKKGPPAAP